MATRLHTTPTSYNGITKYFEPTRDFMLDGEIYTRGEYEIYVEEGDEPIKWGRYTLFKLIRKDNPFKTICPPTVCYNFLVDGVAYSDPTLLYEAIYISIKRLIGESSQEILQEILNKLPDPKSEPNHYSGNGTITFPANTQTSISIKAVGDLQVTVNGVIQTVFADAEISFSADSVLSQAIVVTGNYFIVAIGNKIV